MTLAALFRDPTPPSWLDAQRADTLSSAQTRYLTHKEPPALPLSETPSFFPGAATASSPPGPFQACSPHQEELPRCVTQPGLISTSRHSYFFVTQPVDFCCAKGDPVVQAFDSLYVHKHSLFPRLLFLPRGDPQRPHQPCVSTARPGSQRGCLVHSHRERVTALPAKTPQPKASRSATISATSPHSTRATVTGQKSFHGGTAAPSASRPAHSHQPPPSSLYLLLFKQPFKQQTHSRFSPGLHVVKSTTKPAITSLVTILHSVWAPLGGKLQETGCLLQEISTSHTSHGEGLILTGFLMLLPEYKD